MGYKVKTAFKKSRPVFIVIIALWIVFGLGIVAPLSVSMVDATIDGVFDFGMCIENVLNNVSDFGGNISKAFSSEYIGTYIKNMVYFAVVLFFFAIVGIMKMFPKHEYSDIEHGSSDWCEGGEQYSILHKSKGILLAEKHYLPVDKRGNTNVLVVGRFRFW
jgi:hypothetical protein